MDTDLTPFTPPEDSDDSLSRALGALDSDDDAPSEEGATDGDPWEIPALTLPSGARVEFRRIDELTSKDVRWLRKSLDTDGPGSFLNDLYERGAVMLIVGWDAATRGGRPLPIPRKDAAALGQLSARDGAAIEKHLRKPLVRLVRGDEGK